MSFYGECPQIDVSLVKDQETEFTEIELGEED